MKALPLPPRLDRLQQGALAAGALGLILCGVGLFLDADQFFRSWLFAFLFWIGVAIGCLSITLIHNLTGGMWGLVVRRFLEAATRTLPYCPLLFAPLLFGLPRLYLWARPEAVAADAVLRHKMLYLNVPFFVGRSVFYFATWALIVYVLSRWSAELDTGRDNLLVWRRLRGVGGVGLLLMGLTITFSAVDWAMSLNPHWYSTVYGILFMVGQVLSAMAFVIVLVALFGSQKPLADVLGKTEVHDLGKLLLAFVMLWAYINISQFLIVWSGNLPEEIPFYIQRLHGGWQWLALILVLFHFVLPFLMLLSRDLKRNARLLGAVAGTILLVRMIDLYWLVAPDLAGHGHESAGLHVHWLDLAALIGIGGLWLFAFAWQLRGRPLLPIGEPEIRERLAAATP